MTDLVIKPRQRPLVGDIDSTHFKSALGALRDSTDNLENGLLAALPPADRSQLQPLFEPVELQPRTVLEAPGRAPQDIYFPLGGLISVAVGSRPPRIEVGVVGRDGCTSPLSLLGEGDGLHDAAVQVGGPAFRITRSDLLQAMADSAALRAVIQGYIRDFVEQIGQSALIHSYGSIEERVARRLLQASERLGVQGLELTHDALAQVLGVRRPSVTLALQALEGRGMVRSRRRLIEILDRDGLADTVGKFRERRFATAPRER
jgi:CRP-like cAMP-binding protein